MIKDNIDIMYAKQHEAPVLGSPTLIANTIPEQHCLQGCHMQSNYLVKFKHTREWACALGGCSTAQNHSNELIQALSHTKAGEDPGFPLEGVTNPPREGVNMQNFPKTAWN